MLYFDGLTVYQNSDTLEQNIACVNDQPALLYFQPRIIQHVMIDLENIPNYQLAHCPHPVVARLVRKFVVSLTSCQLVTIPNSSFREHATLCLWRWMCSEKQNGVSRPYFMDRNEKGGVYSFVRGKQHPIFHFIAG